MHVLFTLDTWGLVGGTERYAIVAVTELVRRGHRVTVLCREVGGASAGVEDVEVVEFPRLSGTDLTAEAAAELGERLRTLAPDVVYLSALRNLDALRALLDAAPVVRFVHDHTLFCPGLNKYRETGDTCRDAMGLVCLKRYWFGAGCVCFKPAGHANTLVDPVREVLARRRELALVRRATHVLTNSEYMRAELLKVGFQPARTSVLYYFTRSNTEDQPGGELPADTAAFLDRAEAPVLLTPARLTLPDKGVDYLLTALGKVRGDFRAVVAGSGPAEDFLREKAREEGLAERVHFTGWLESAAIETLYDRADVVVCPSVWDEPFGLVGIEAMAHERPVVAFGVGGIPEWLDDGETGLLVTRKDTDALAGALDRLLEDPELGRRLGRRGREVVAERFAREPHLDTLEAILTEAAGTKAR